MPADAASTPPAHFRCQIDLARTHRLGAELAELCRRDPARVAQVLDAADARLAQPDKSFGGLKNLSASLSALLLSEADVAALRQTARKLYELVERTLDWIVATPAVRDRVARDYRRIFPYLRRTPGANRWQTVSRYDAVVDENGRLCIIELNTGCPAGFMHAEAFTRTTRSALAELRVRGFDAATPNELQSRTIRPGALVDGLLAVERRSGIEPAMVALVVDENQLTHEFDLMLANLTNRGRRAAIADARSLRFDGKALRHGDDVISLAYDKFRISIPTSRNHCWRDGFETRYADFLAAIQADAVVAVNNLAAQTIAEDKSLLGVLLDGTADELFNPDERRFLAENVQWTARLEPGPVRRHGETIDLLPYVAGHRDEFVIKPTSEGRGFGVVIGRECDAADWRALCQVDPATPRVVQDYIEPARVSVVSRDAAGIEARDMYVTLGLANVCGEYAGVLSRVSPSRVTNVARQGFVQAVIGE